MADQFSDDDLRELHRLVQEAALKAYPNPERNGCPGPEVLDEIASLPNPSRHSAYEHVKRCSPCLQEMLDLQEVRIRDTGGIRRRHLIWAIGVSIILLISAGLIFKAVRPFGSKPGSLTEVANLKTINLSNYGTYRGGEGTERLNEVLLPGALLKLRILLPRFSERGHYTVSVVKERKNGEVVSRGSGEAMGNDLHASVTVRLDLRSVKPGFYFLVTTHNANESYYYPVEVK